MISLDVTITAYKIKYSLQFDLRQWRSLESAHKFLDKRNEPLHHQCLTTCIVFQDEFQTLQTQTFPNSTYFF